MKTLGWPVSWGNKQKFAICFQKLSQRDKYFEQVAKRDIPLNLGKNFDPQKIDVELSIRPDDDSWGPGGARDSKWNKDLGKFFLVSILFKNTSEMS